MMDIGIKLEILRVLLKEAYGNSNNYDEIY